MKNKIILGFVLSLSLSHAFAVNEQIIFAKSYLNKLSSSSNNDTVLNKSSSFSLAPNKELKSGNKNELLKTLQEQIGLEQTGVMDKETMSYLKEFQKQNDLNVTQTLDYNTWFAMFEQNIDWKIQTVQNAQKSWENILNKQAASKSKKFIVVNIPTMTLTAYDWDGSEAHEALSSRVVVGKFKTQTPLKDFQIISIKYNPTWTPTDGILKRGAYKNGQLDLNWVKSHGLRVFDESGEEVDVNDVDVHQKYRFQQPAGDRNALGVLKFETNSPDNIYLHDTNEKHYFGYNTRIYSSGCIRVQEFKDLANWIRDANDVNEKLKKKETYYEKVNKTPVYLTYNQVVFYGSDEPFFAPDIYGINNNTEFKK